MAIFLALGVIIVIGLLLEKIYEKNWAKGLRVKLAFDRAEAEEGEDIEILEKISNSSRLYLPYIYLKYDIHRNNSPIKGRSGIFSLLNRQMVTRHISYSCKKRGCYNIGNTYLVFKGLFLRSTLERKMVQRSKLIVYPRLMDVSGVPIKHILTEGEHEHNPRIIEDRLAFRDIREYTDTDSMSWINWNATARTDELMVNTYEDMRRACVAIVMELPDSFYEEADMLQEANISIAASIYVHMLNNRIPVSFISNGMDAYTNMTVCLPQRSDSGYTKEVLESFARIGGVAKDENVWMPKDLTSQHSIILISQMGDLSKGLKGEVIQLAERGCDVLWIVVSSKRDVKAVDEAREKIVMYGLERRVTIYEWE